MNGMFSDKQMLIDRMQAWVSKYEQASIAATHTVMDQIWLAGRNKFDPNFG